jgi:hypothetical protein
MYLFVFRGSSTCVIVSCLFVCFLSFPLMISLAFTLLFFVFFVGSLHFVKDRAPRVLPYIIVPPTYTEQLQRQLENTIQGSKSLDKYFHEMKKALR